MQRHFRSLLALLAIAVIGLLALAACDDPERANDGYILVFYYEGKFIPVEQMHKAPADARDDDHWHGGLVVTLQNKSLSVPHPQCGFGRDGDLNVIKCSCPTTTKASSAPTRIGSSTPRRTSGRLQAP
jgi:hypothetical protein